MNPCSVITNTTPEPPRTTDASHPCRGDSFHYYLLHCVGRSIVPFEAILRPVSCPEPVWGVTMGAANRCVPQFILGGSNDRMPWWGQWPQAVQAKAGGPRPRHACLAQSDCPNAWTLCYKARWGDGQWAGKSGGVYGECDVNIDGIVLL